MTGGIDRQFERLGIHPRFPKILPYLKSLDSFDDSWEQYCLPAVCRFIREGNFLRPPNDGLPESNYSYYSATQDLAFGAVELQRHAIRKALNNNSSWIFEWRRAVAYWFWSDYVNGAADALRVERGVKNSNMAALSLGYGSPVIAGCVILGWEQQALELARRLIFSIENLPVYDHGDSMHRRTQHFILRLIRSWQGWPDKGPACAFDEPLFNVLVEGWRKLEPESLGPLLLAACDRHSHQARPDSSKAHHDLSDVRYTYWPFEVLMVLRLREMHGLVNPNLDHPLMNTLLGRLPEASSMYTDEIIEGVMARVWEMQPKFKIEAQRVE
jgi:hypothetical protein